MNTQSKEKTRESTNVSLIIRGPGGQPHYVNLEELSEMFHHITIDTQYNTIDYIYYALERIYNALIENCSDEVTVGEIKPQIFLLKNLMKGVERSFVEVPKNLQ